MAECECKEHRLSHLLIVFARYPQVGECKTRLIAHVGRQAATDVHADMTRFTIAWASEAAKHPDIGLQVRFTGGSQEAMRAEFGAGPDYVPQCDGDLGQRLREAVEQAAKQGLERVVVVGTDCPQLNCDFALQAFASLAHHDVCISPATDGGYTLLGLQTKVSNPQAVHDALFDSICWGSSGVLLETLHALGATGARVRLLQTLSDVDYPSDLPVWEQAQAGMSPPKPHTSIIIPVLGRETRLAQVLNTASKPPWVEAIIVAADIEGETLKVAAENKAQYIVGAKPRSKQMNLGASVARGDTLLFLHADTALPHDYLDAVQSRLADDACVGGAFKLGIDSDRIMARCIEWGVNVRSTMLRLPYGDQAMFVRATVFRALNGFAEQPIMEDYDFVRRLRRRGRISICSAQVRTSPRRWHRVGFVKATALNQLIIVAYHLGVSPARLARLYRAAKKKSPVA